MTGWEQAWQQKITPWDAGDVQPALRELLDERWHDVGVPLDSLKDGKALVAGCGRVSPSSLSRSHSGGGTSPALSGRKGCSPACGLLRAAMRPSSLSTASRPSASTCRRPLYKSRAPISLRRRTRRPTSPCGFGRCHHDPGARRTDRSTLAVKPGTFLSLLPPREALI